MIALAFWYVALGSDITSWRAVGPFPTAVDCRMDQSYYAAEGGTTSECYSKGEN